MDLAQTCCPYCSGPNAVQSRYIYRFVEICGVVSTQPRLRAVEIYCANCHHTISITPLM